MLPLLLVKLSEKLDRNGFRLNLSTGIKNTGLIMSIVSALLECQAIIDFKKFSGKLPVTAIPPYNKLVRKGIYSIWRHPVYLFYTLMITGLALVSGSGGFLFVILPVFVIITYAHARIEENWLIKKHGKYYINYMKRTSLVFPCKKIGEYIFTGLKKFSIE